MIINLDLNDNMTLEQLAIAIAETIPKQILVNDADRFQADKNEVKSFKRLKARPCCDRQLVIKYMSHYQFTPANARTILNIVINNLMDSLGNKDPHDLCYLMKKRIRWAYDSLEEEIERVLRNRYNTPESINILREEAARERENRVRPVN